MVLQQAGDLAATQTQRSADDEEWRLRSLRSLGVLDTRPDERFDRLTRICRQLFDVPISLLALVDEGRQWHLSRQGFPAPELPRSQSFCSVAIEQPDVFVVEDASTDPRFADNPLVTGPEHIRFYAGYPLQGRGGHSIGSLCVLDRRPRRLTELQRQLLRDLGRHLQDDLLLSGDVQRAADLQRSLLPRQRPVLAGFDFAAGWLPSWEVGGDFYDWYELPTGVAITVADVMGKGLPAALIGAAVRGVLRAETRRAGVAEALERTAEGLEPDLAGAASFVTAFHATIGADGTVEYVDAGHNLALLIRADRTLITLESDGLPVGVLPGQSWTAGTVRLSPGESLLVFSDGLLDAFGGRRSDLAGICEVFTGAPDPQDGIRRLMDAAAPGEDDVTVLAVSARPAGS